MLVCDGWGCLVGFGGVFWVVLGCSGMVRCWVLVVAVLFLGLVIALGCGIWFAWAVVFPGVGVM